MSSLSLLSDTLAFLKDKEITRVSGIGNQSKGFSANKAINGYARGLFRNWLLSPVAVVQTIDGEQRESVIPRLYTLKSRALIQEAIQWESMGNYDRISAIGSLMLLREYMVMQYQGNFDETRISSSDKQYLGNDKFFSENYDKRISNNRFSR